MRGRGQEGSHVGGGVRREVMREEGSGGSHEGGGVRREQ